MQCLFIISFLLKLKMCREGPKIKTDDDDCILIADEEMWKQKKSRVEGEIELEVNKGDVQMDRKKVE